MKKALALALALATAISLSACGGGNKTPAASGSTSTAAPTGGDASIVLKVAHVEAEDRSTHKALLEFEKEVEEKSDGRIDVQIYPNAELGGDEELCEAVAMGTIQMALPSTSVLTSYNEEIGVLDMPYLFKDAQSAFNALDGDLGDQISEWIAGNGFVSLGYTYNGPRCTTNSVHPISTPADLAGLKIRVMSSPVFIRMYEVLGANPTPMSFSEVFTGLQQNVIDGQESPLSTIDSSSFAEVQKYLSLTGHFWTNECLLINEKLWESLPEEWQTILQEEVDACETRIREKNIQSDQDLVAKLESEGMEVNEVDKSAFAEKLQPLYDEWEGKVIGSDLMNAYREYSGY